MPKSSTKGTKHTKAEVTTHINDNLVRVVTVGTLGTYGPAYLTVKGARKLANDLLNAATIKENQ